MEAILKFNSNFREELSAEIKPCDIVFIDQYFSEKFALNEAGWPRNDISAFEQAQSESDAAQILERLQEISVDSSFDEMSNEEKFDLVCPRRAYSDPVLFAQYQDKITKVLYERELKKAKLEREQLEHMTQDDEKQKQNIIDSNNDASSDSVVKSVSTDKQ